MSFSERIDKDIKISMREKARERLEALRAVKTAFMLARTEKGAGSQLSEQEETKIIQKLVKQRKDSARIYEEQNRQDLAEKELQEAEFISEYLPEPMTEEELTNYLSKLINEMNATGMKDMGKVMGRASSELAGMADGKLISEKVKKLLQ
jgi:hypothetical protein